MLKNEINTIVNLCDSLKNEYKSTFFEPVNEEVMKRWENDNVIMISESYKEWLRFSNGAVIRGLLAHFYGVEGFEVNNPDYPEECVIIGSLLGDGERLAFSKITGKIVRINHGYIREYDDFSLFLNQMIIRMLDRKKTENISFFNKISVPERKDFLKRLQEKSLDEYSDFIDDLRDVAIQTFWSYERELVKQGECTRDWMPEQIEAIYNISFETGAYRKNAGAAIYLDQKGKVAVKKHGDEVVPDVYEAHQMFSVNAYPEYAGIYKNIQALARNNSEHIKAHRGSYQNSTCWYYDYEGGSYHKIGG